MEETENSFQLLKDLVQRFRVCWEVWPEERIIEGGRRKIGFSLELYGTHEPRVEHPSAGCLECLPVYDALRTIATAILPREERPSTYEIGVYDRALHYTLKHGDRPDVELPIKIFHRHDFESPVDQCEERCLGEMKQHLRELGAPEGWWRSRNEEHR